MTEKIKKLCNSCKDIILVFINWEKESVLAFLLKLILVAGGIYLIINLLPLILGVLFIGILCWWDKSDTVNITQPTVTPKQLQPTSPDEYAARDILTKILKKNASALDIVKPSNVDDITPTNYSVIQFENGAIIYRFIVQMLPNEDYDFNSMRSILNTKIKQKLNAGYRNLPASVLGGIETFVLTEIGTDIYHRDYLYMDIVPITSQVQQDYANNKLHPPYYSMTENLNLFDEEF